MSDALSPNAPSTPTPAEWSPARHRCWLTAQVQSLLMLAVLGWLLARLVWLYYFFGLFFFLVAGLLVGAVSFRKARAARPIEKGRLVRGVLIVALGSMFITIVWEFRHFAATVGLPPKFANARNAAVAAGRSSRDVQARAAEAFEAHVKKSFPPGGAIGYLLWSTRSGEVKLTVDSATEVIRTPHAGWVWPVRTTTAAVLLAAGLWFGLESLRSSSPITNILQSGEEGEEID